MAYASTLLLISEQNKTGKQTEHEPEAGANAEAMVDSSFQVALSDLGALLSYRAQAHRRVVPHTMGWALVHQSLIKNMPRVLLLAYLP